MAQPINTTALHQYAQAFSQHTCDSFFAQQETISGKDIVSFTDIPQVNYLILFKLFNSWQQEAGRLQSPYFDYSPDEVKTALEQLMNTLSRHIQVNREAFEPLVANATVATLQLILTPGDQLVSIVKDIDFQPLTLQRLQEQTRYIRLNRSVWEGLLAQLQADGTGSTNTISLDKALGVLEEVLASSTSILENPETLLSQFSAYVPLQLSDLEKPAEEVAEEPNTAVETEEREVASRSFFDSLPDDTLSTAKENTISEPVITETAAQVTPKTDALPTESVTEKKAKPTHSPELPPVPMTVIPEIKAEDVKVDIEQFAKAANKPLVTVLSVKKKSEEITLNDTLNRDQTTLNEKLRKEDSTFIEKAQNQPITSIKDALNLNQKYYFINSLFGGDNIAFAQAIHELEQTTDLTSAMRLLEVKYAHSLAWDMEGEEYKGFLDVIERKFAN